MKKFIKLFFVFTLSLILLAGCSDFVDFNTSNINVGGRVVTENSNSAVADVVITDAKSGETIETCSEGEWELNIVGRPEEAEIYAAKDGWEFSPEKQVVNSDNMGVIFEGTCVATEDLDSSDPSGPGTGTGTFSISGDVVDDEGETVNAVKLTLTDEDGEITYDYSDRDGEFEFSNLKGEITITPDKDGYIFEPEYRRANKDRDNIDFIAIKQYYHIEGVVTDKEGTPISNVKIKLNDGQYDSVITNINGEFTKDNLTGQVELEPIKDDYTFSPANINLREADDNIEIIAMRGSYDIAGLILDDNGEPLNGVDIELIDSNDQLIDTAITGFEGEYSYSGLEGEIRVIPEKEGYTFDPIDRTIIDEDKEVDFKAIAKDYDIEGVIVDQVGDAVNGVEIILRDENNNEIDRITSGLEGQYNYTGLEGRVRAIPEKEGYTFDPIDRTIIGEDKEVDFEVQKNLYSVSGKAYSNNYDPIPHVKIHFYHKNSGEKIGYAITDENGEWIKDNLWGVIIIEPQGTAENDYRENFDPKRTEVSNGSEEIVFTIY